MFCSLCSHAICVLYVFTLYPIHIIIAFLHIPFLSTVLKPFAAGKNYHIFGMFV